MTIRKVSISLAWALAALLILAGAALAVTEHYGITDFLNLYNNDAAAPNIEGQRIDQSITAGGYELTLHEAYYENDTVYLLFTGDAIPELIGVHELFDITFEANEYAKIGSSAQTVRGWQTSLVRITPEVPHDTETIHIAAKDDPAQTLTVTIQRSYPQAEPLIACEVIDPCMEQAGITITGYDIIPTGLNTELHLYLELDPAQMNVTEYAYAPTFYRDRDCWHSGPDCPARKRNNAQPDISPGEILESGLAPCAECGAQLAYMFFANAQPFADGMHNKHFCRDGDRWHYSNSCPELEGGDHVFELSAADILAGDFIPCETCNSADFIHRLGSPNDATHLHFECIAQGETENMELPIYHEPVYTETGERDLYHMEVVLTCDEGDIELARIWGLTGELSLTVHDSTALWDYGDPAALRIEFLK